MDNTIHSLLNRFFSERSIPLRTKLIIFPLTLIAIVVLVVYIQQGYFTQEEARIILYTFYILIFLNTFFCGFAPGIVTAALSSYLAINIIGPGWINFDQITFVQMEIFPFVALYFLVTVTVDWFRENIEKLKAQLEENQRLYQQARHMEQLALAGEIAAGIAHEIRNPLTVVQGYIQLLSSKHHGQDDKESFTLLLDELKRTNQIISDFLRFSRPHEPQKEPVQLNQVIKTATSLMNAEVHKKNVILSTVLADNLPFLLLDHNQIMQVFLNLISNALQAMTNGGTLLITTEFSRFHHEVVVRVKDSGVGIAQENLQRIFTPFFTTKEKGTGLGLAITQSIILTHGGHIEAASSPGEGTQFTIIFPVPEGDFAKGAVS